MQTNNVTPPTNGAAESHAYPVGGANIHPIPEIGENDPLEPPVADEDTEAPAEPLREVPERDASNYAPVSDPRASVRPAQQAMSGFNYTLTFLFLHERDHENANEPVNCPEYVGPDLANYALTRVIPSGANVTIDLCHSVLKYMREDQPDQMVAIVTVGNTGSVENVIDTPRYLLTLNDVFLADLTSEFYREEIGPLIERARNVFVASSRMEAETRTADALTALAQTIVEFVKR